MTRAELESLTAEDRQRLLVAGDLKYPRGAVGYLGVTVPIYMTQRAYAMVAYSSEPRKLDVVNPPVDLKPLIDAGALVLFVIVERGDCDNQLVIGAVVKGADGVLTVALAAELG